jgi:hypothetical protein
MIFSGVRYENEPSSIICRLTSDLFKNALEVKQMIAADDG